MKNHANETRRRQNKRYGRLVAKENFRYKLKQHSSPETSRMWNEGEERFDPQRLDWIKLDGIAYLARVT